MLRFLQRTAFLLIAALCIATSAPAADMLRAGFGVADITPELQPEKPIWLAGKELGRAATGVHDRLFARAVVLSDGAKKFALVSVDSIGLPYPAVSNARAKLPGFDYVLVASTHSHDSPDVVGVWGKSRGESGVVPEYVQLVEDRIADAVRQADSALVEVRAEYGTAEDESLVGDFRQPEVYDGVLRLLRFTRVSDGKPYGILVQWNSHGIEPKGNALITRDFMGFTVDALERRHNCPAIYFQGAIGGLMGTPRGLVAEARAGRVASDTFGFIRVCGEAIADLAERAIQQTEPITLTPLAVFAKPISIPLANDNFRAARAGGVLKRPVYTWTGNLDQRGDEVPLGKTDGEQALVTEVGYLRLGELHVAAIPGELYPELVYGKFQDPADPGADFPDAPLETPVTKILPGKKIMILGLANDLIGYIIPKRQWDVRPPFAYGLKSAQYGEVNSVGPETAGMLMQALAARVAQANPKSAKKPDPAFEEVVDDPALPRVLLIGDSISIGYTVPVRELLRGKANVHRIPTNGGPTTNGLRNLDAWLGDKKWDVIHFNWGLHDLKHVDAKGATVAPDKGQRQVPPEEYRENLQKLVKRLKTTGAKLVWCSTTPVPPRASGRISGDELKYNQIAAEIMAAEQVPTDDLHAFAAARLGEIQQKANVHFTPAGSRVLAEQVSQTILDALGR